MTQNDPIFEWNEKRLQAAQLVAEDRLSDEQISSQVGIGRKTLQRWKTRAEFKAKVQAIIDQTAAALKAKGIRSRENRLRALNDRHDRMTRLIEARAQDLAKEVAGGDTGLLVRQIKFSKHGSEFQYVFDAALVKELREHEKQAAIETGEWTEKKELSGPEGSSLLGDLVDKLARVYGKNDKGSESD